ncbi:MAG: 50S ribosomal protein L11 methyltransferase [Desulfobacterales bacterium]|nr:50S ribosomal protein L11 methyltransferase [Desulfobacterales bacterium]MDD4072410.1 50S ribosomal protein L11 methyltransferase [Desulfobacterales bacterium]MDD4393288.1 50S ribosomal protein L11 methyltransferase [Desulfobacterales bacterium]
MKWIEAQVIFDSGDKQLAVDLISEAFYNLGVKGVVVADPELEPEEGWADQIETRAEKDSVTGYFPDSDASCDKCRRLEQALRQLEADQDLCCRIEYRKIEEEDWANSWKEYFRPEKVGERIVVKPTWREYFPREEEIVIEIDPGMAFGTGTHPTTSLCVQMLETYVTPDVSFLDIGTGSGILMVAAAKLGAEKVHGVDMDEVAVQVARKNLELNQIRPDQFTVAHGDLVTGVEETFDIAAANILSHVIITLLDSVAMVLNPGGLLICSGIIEEHRDSVLLKMMSCGFEILDVRSKDSWVAICARYPTAPAI